LLLRAGRGQNAVGWVDALLLCCYVLFRFISAGWRGAIPTAVMTTTIILQQQQQQQPLKDVDDVSSTVTSLIAGARM